MQSKTSFLQRVLTSGTIAGLATAGTAALAGRRENGSYAAPLNATSHVVWGDQAAMKNSPSFKYTLTGFLVNHASTLFWAAVQDRLFSSRRLKLFRRRNPVLQALVGGAAVTAAAYITDYYLVPDRLTPGFERRLSDSSLGMIYGALALGLAAGTYLSNRRR